MTIAARQKRCVLAVNTLSHLHWAVVLSQNIRAVEPNTDMLIFLIDVSQAAIDAQTAWPFAPEVQLIGADAIKDPLFKELRRYFTGWEYAAAAKAFALEFALDVLGYEKALLLDTDIYCYASLDAVWRALDENVMALTPHITAPFPSDGQSPDELEIASFGFINAGFWACRGDARTSEILAWIKPKLAHFGFIIPSLSISAEQTWMSCLPWVFPDAVAVLRHPGLNVAYWNLHERRLKTDLDGIHSNGEKLVFFHYSGFDFSIRHVLTKHPVRHADAENTAVLLPMMKAYADKLRSAKEALPYATADLPASRQRLWRRFCVYRKVYGVSHPLCEKALLAIAAQRMASLWARGNKMLAQTWRLFNGKE